MRSTAQPRSGTDLHFRDWEGQKRSVGGNEGGGRPGNISAAHQMALVRGLAGLQQQLQHVISIQNTCCSRMFSTTDPAAAIYRMTRLRVVDNSSLGEESVRRGKPPRVIHVYKKNSIGKVGDKVLVAIMGQKKKALIVGHKMEGPRMTPKFDSNNIILLEDSGNPTGTRIKVPVPSLLRKKAADQSKVLAIASRFI
ncbi:PREDICTED: 39S ribosomal protein L14, mitochondrial-like isoform X1 [Branchiostoma belcheri]|uniref:Large ribosomal subunit protein uL14m n=2 Tax=Branchiostoma belcheri TaxID=7741 RepID=A0A6P4YMN0_BRABE|nr:PREDICTED: 39S ribosomal protein L14, mitochondrial-like isoform X1 [Branchiostoma belcheri]